MPSGIPPGPSYPSWIQSIGFWTRPLAFLERCRARYGKRFTIRLPLAPPFVMISDPEEVKQVFTAPPDVLHPGEGARVLEPVVGTNSVILLDEGPHLEQRKLMLPAFHGEKMERLSDLIAEVAEREVASWPRGEPIELGPRLQRLTMEIILRAVFGLDPGERLDALRERLSAMLAFGDRPISLLPPPPGRVASGARATRPIRRLPAPPGGGRRAALRADRRATAARRPSATTSSACCSRRATRTDRRCRRRSCATS